MFLPNYVSRGTLRYVLYLSYIKNSNIYVSRETYIYQACSFSIFLNTNY